MTNVSHINSHTGRSESLFGVGNSTIETLLRDTKQFNGLAACQYRVDQVLVRHVAFVLIACIVLQRLPRHPEEAL
jgi:hypothetical protein